MVSDVEAAYVAGILDGEGSISLIRIRKSRLPSPQVAVTSTDRELLEWLKLRFGGSIIQKRRRLPIHSQAYEWKLADRLALNVIELARPYLVIQRKIRRADLLLEAYIASTPSNGRYTTEMLEQKNSLIRRFSSLP
jgi:hypothetical protein